MILSLHGIQVVNRAGYNALFTGKGKSSVTQATAFKKLLANAEENVPNMQKVLISFENCGYYENIKSMYRYYGPNDLSASRLFLVYSNK